MCGIAGVVQGTGAAARPVTRAVLRAMAEALASRGPDGEGLHLEPDGGAGLAHRRLAIIDIANGAQPMANEDGTLHVVFNGEIYNHRELRARLAKAGHQFRTHHCDTEVLLHGWEQWGAGLFERLRGMFALGLWDARRRELILARDRAGEKPLVYAPLEGGGLAFASDLRALAAVPGWRRVVDAEALSHYLALQYVPHPWTIFEGARALPPATWLRWRANDAEPTLTRYWRPRFATDPARAPLSPREAVEAVRDHLDEAVRTRLEAEVPLGVFLSGGLDSAAVAALMRRHLSGTLRTFTIGFEEAPFDERPHARAVARHLGTRHEEFVVKADAAEALPRIAALTDQPLADPATLPLWHLARLARQSVTVALGGDGGDEVFFGYPRYNGFAPVPWWPRVPEPVRRVLDVALRGATVPRLALVRHVNALSLMDPRRQYAEAMRHMRAEQVRALLAPEFAPVPAPTDRVVTIARMRGLAPPDAFLAADWDSYLPGALMTKTDRMTMAVGLEARAPFLDHKLADFAWSLPPSLRGIRRRAEPPWVMRKALLRAAVRGLVPPEVLQRRKAGFAVPVAAWLRGPLRPLLGDALESLGARGWLRRDAMRRLGHEHLAGVVDHKRPLWVLLSLELWARAHLDARR